MVIVPDEHIVVAGEQVPCLLAPRFTEPILPLPWRRLPTTGPLEAEVTT